MVWEPMMFFTNNINEKFNLFNIFHKHIECTFVNPFYSKNSTFEKNE